VLPCLHPPLATEPLVSHPKAEPLGPVDLVVAHFGREIDQALVVEIGSGLEDVTDIGIDQDGGVPAEISRRNVLGDRRGRTRSTSVGAAL
jgi:hypothetical protein